MLKENIFLFHVEISYNFKLGTIFGLSVPELQLFPSKSHPPSHCGILLYSNSPSALSAQALRARARAGLIDFEIVFGF